MTTRTILCLLTGLAFCLGGCTSDSNSSAPSGSVPSATRNELPPRKASVALPLLDQFTPELGLAYIERVLGPYDLDCGSAIHDLWYNLDDGSSIRVRATMAGEVLSIEQQGKLIYDSKKQRKNTNPQSGIRR
jgi:hypothetical protein